MLVSFIAIVATLCTLPASLFDLTDSRPLFSYDIPASPPVAKKVVKKYPVKIERPRLVYNTQRQGGNWTYPGMHSRAAIINHLLSGEHAGKFSRAKLETLSLGALERLHSNDHEGKPFRYSNAVQGVRTQISRPTTRVYFPTQRATAYCPTGT